MRRDLRPLFAPRSIAVVGASDDCAEWGGTVTASLLASRRDDRPLYLVNQRRSTVQGAPAVRSLREVPEAELVLLVVPAEGFEEAVEDALAVGARALVVISAGLGELGEEGRRRELAAAARVRAAGAVMAGPNCPGVADTGSGLHAVAYMRVPAGEIGFVSQSGGVGEEVITRARRSGLGFTRFATVGNQADLEVADVLWSFMGHEQTRVIAVYVEDLRDGRELARAAAALVAAGKPLVLASPGRSAAAARAARSHTGSLTSPSAVVDAVCRATGAVRADSPAELVDLAAALLAGRLPGGPRLAVVSDGGGNGALAADAAVAAGLRVPRFSDALIERLGEVLPPNAGRLNPIDFAMAAADPQAHPRVARVLAGSGEIDALLVGGEFGFWGANFPDLRREADAEQATARQLAELARETGLAMVGQTVHADSPAASLLRAGGVPVYRDLHTAVTVLGKLAARVAATPAGVPALPAPALRLTGDGGYWAAREVLSAAGLPFVAARRAAGLEECLWAAAELGYPVALKALVAEHKSEGGGVMLDIPDPAALEHAVRRLQKRLAAAAFSVERMAPRDGVELIIGCRWDPRFAAVLTVGFGGVFAEVLDDTLTALAPVAEDEIERLLRGLRGAPLLLGARGRPPMDLRAAARAAATLSRFAAAHPDLSDVEINPLLVLPEGVLALDARLVFASAEASAV